MRSNPLAHPARRGILANLNVRKPVTRPDLAKAIGKSLHTTKYHLERLRRAHLVHEHRGRPVAYTLVSSGKQEAAARSLIQEYVMAYVDGHGQASSGDLARFLGLPPSHVNVHAGTLVAKGLLVRTGRPGLPLSFTLAAPAPDVPTQASLRDHARTAVPAVET